MSAGVVAATLLVPGLGAVFALGFGAAHCSDLLGLALGPRLAKAWHMMSK